VWKYLRRFIEGYDASVFSIAAFAQPMPHPVFLIPPSIDPLSEKNLPLSSREVQQVLRDFGIDLSRPMILQVSRFDRFKDQGHQATSWHRVRSESAVGAGGRAHRRPGSVLKEVLKAAGEDSDIHVLSAEHYSDRTINALQTGADIVLQKSLREGFGLTVTEAMWKGKPVIGGNTGGIRLQAFNHRTGFLVDTPEGAAMWIRYLLFHRERIQQIGHNAQELVRQNFLITRHLREYLTLMVALLHGTEDRIDLG
jgi:trehalose synthase